MFLCMYSVYEKKKKNVFIYNDLLQRRHDITGKNRQKNNMRVVNMLFFSFTMDI